MSVYQRSDGRWIVKIKDEAEDRWRQRSFKTEAEARQFAGETEMDNDDNERLTLEEALLVYLQNNPLCDHGVKQYQRLFAGVDRKDGTHVEGPCEFLRHKFVDRLTRRDLDAVRENLRKTGVGDSTINLATVRINAAFNWCVREEFIARNPWGKFGRLKHVETKSRAGNPDDFWKIYQELPAWFQWACRTALALCLRPGIQELFRLTWNAFKWESRTVVVYMPKVRRSKTVFPPQWYLLEARPRYEADMAAGQVYVCRNSLDKPVHRYDEAWGKAVQRAGVNPMPPYAMRHIAASMMLAAGADLAAVAAQLGHRDMTTTAHFYTHALASGQMHAGEAVALPNLVQNGAESGHKDK